MIILKRRHLDVWVETKVGMSGEYKLVVRHSDGTIKRETPWFDNLILDSGLNAMGTIATIAGCAIGTGTAATLTTQTTLGALSAYTTTTNGNVDSVSASAPYNQARTITFRFALGALNGNYTEVGVGWNSTNMLSRALILDGVGSPTTLTVTSAEQLDVVYRLRVYCPTADVVTVNTISGVSYNVTGRAALSATGYGAVQQTGVGPARLASPFDANHMTAYAGQIGTVTSLPSGVSVNTSATVTETAYVNNSTSRQTTYAIPLTAVLTGSVPMKSFAFKTSGLGNMFMQYQFEKVSDSTGIDKTTSNTLSLTFQVSWARRP